MGKVEIHGFIETKVTKFASDVNVYCPKEFLGKGFIL